jgi:hypothetical protein
VNLSDFIWLAIVFAMLLVMLVLENIRGYNQGVSDSILKPGSENVKRALITMSKKTGYIIK